MRRSHQFAFIVSISLKVFNIPFDAYFVTKEGKRVLYDLCFFHPLGSIRLRSSGSQYHGKRDACLFDLYPFSSSRFFKEFCPSFPSIVKVTKFVAAFLISAFCWTLGIII